ncbi:CAP domain-containing protein [Jiella sp. MQZ9-1]|uniref:CAP domain-containing protein n=1 Tax=Jiella flava TaxID=2816857 RepID=A0A939JXV6_9HYPH|nr:CAP domain-containing protein [Jiella flava]MBO0664492.1 CAP domain-containing protein [Jiella flava]MCD2473128.1 CAP domain-containing protein [Jiella flava]
MIRLERSRQAVRQPKLAVALALFLGLAGCAVTPGSVNVASTHLIPVDRQVALSSINAFRAAYGMPALHYNAVLEKAAERQARAMAARGKLSHDVDGSLPGRIGYFGYDAKAAAENIGWNYRSTPAVIEGWKNSSGHRKNLLNPLVREAGFAAAVGPDGEPYWALILGAVSRPSIGIFGRDKPRPGD